jgi:hypothetical protein
MRPWSDRTADPVEQRPEAGCTQVARDGSAANKADTIDER